MNKEFPQGFVFGTGTSAYQIEGAWNVDGKGPSIWDQFTHIPDNIKDGTTGDIATDHYHRYEEDVKIMKELGLRAYRFSVSWPRIFPSGEGRVEPRGLDFYDKLTDSLLEAGIDPWITLFHWDLPQSLEDIGGWPNRVNAVHFEKYADTVTRKLGDRVKNWIPINEPFVSSYLGYYTGTLAPGRKSFKDYLASAHTQLIAHGRSIPVIRANVPESNIGSTFNLNPFYPETQSPEDVAAAKRGDGLLNRWYLDAIYKGEYPADMMELWRDDLPEIREGDMEKISTPTDFLGLNYYFPAWVKDAPNTPPYNAVQIDRPEMEHSDMGEFWVTAPDGLAQILERVSNDYGVKNIYVTENGIAVPDTVENGQIMDPRRTYYLEQHLDAVRTAIANGVNVRGYMYWSLLDNFEWAEGNRMRFGIVRVDPKTQERTIKQSGRRYSEIIANNSL